MATGITYQTIIARLEEMCASRSEDIQELQTKLISAHVEADSLRLSIELALINLEDGLTYQTICSQLRTALNVRRD
jgi:hypothetical protein